MRFYVKEQKDFFESLKYPLGVSLACFLMLRNSKYIEIYKKANYVCKNTFIIKITCHLLNINNNFLIVFFLITFYYCYYDFLLK